MVCARAYRACLAIFFGLDYTRSLVRSLSLPQRSCILANYSHACSTYCQTFSLLATDPSDSLVVRIRWKLRVRRMLTVSSGTVHAWRRLGRLAPLS